MCLSKNTALACLLFTSASAFTAPSSTHRVGTTLNAEKEPEMSQALPFAPRPKLLDGMLPGDVGFDPFNLAGDDKESLVFKREAEIKHGRLAMLAAVGWPLAELFDKKIAALLNLPTALTNAGSSPSTLNGGLEKIEPEYWLLVLCIAGIFEIDSRTTKAEKGKDYVLGDCGFDPLNLFPENKKDQFAMQTKEIKHGRIAMMAILGYVVQEALYRTPVTAETPFFFSPIWAAQETKRVFHFFSLRPASPASPP